MSLESLVKLISDSSLTKELLKRLEKKERPTFSGSSKTGRVIIASALAKKEDRPLIIIVPTLEEATRWLSLLELMGWEKTFLYPTSESSPYETVDVTTEIIWGQLQVLSELIKKENKSSLAIVATERSLQPHLPEPSLLIENTKVLCKNDIIDLEEISMHLTKQGYKRLSTIDQEGTWCRRGDILDIFPVSNELPVRIELFGDAIEKIREFDPISQKSLDEISSVNITPNGFNSLILNTLNKLGIEKLSKFIDNDAIEKLNQGEGIKNQRFLMSIAWERPACILDYLCRNSALVVDERDQLIAHAKEWFKHINENYIEINKSYINQKKIFVPPNLHRDFKSSLNLLDNFWGFDMSEIHNSQNCDNSIDLSSKSIPVLTNQFGKMALLIKEYQNKKNNVFIYSAQPSRTVALLEEHDCFSKFIPNPFDKNSIHELIKRNTPVSLKLNHLVEIEGLNLPAWKIVLITDREFFGQQNINTPGYIRKRKSSSSNTVDPSKMCPGDYVVHRNHGIGKFIRIEKFSLSGRFRDYLVIQYEDGKLSVAADQLGSLGRYRNTGNSNPKVNKLGGTVWIKNKEKAKKSAKKLAVDLIKLYAERQSAKGFKYPQDGPWQNELEDSFPYKPTPDQFSAIKDVKRDMEKEQPMDRLVCGDVGFGKTEVAIRAVFKAITAGKQTAFLAPTTILAQQHWRTISDRFAPYPIKVALLNRFKTKAEKKSIAKDLKDGKIDAIVGTHLILSKNVEFQKLGLLVIDEEQRFGVNQKEKIKSLKKDVDVLTLSATPIPRTLYMSLSGVREMSLITTPPPLRRSIKTHLCPIDYETIRSAITQELDRGGQIFYVVPKISGINDIAEKLKKIIPKIKIIIAHGQMEEGLLENSMVAFNAGEADLMLCTTIIESGLDIPRVNTILIEDSHTFGLAQLYQLRGRVGRSGIQAHAWLFYPSNKILNDSSRKRLRAIQEFADLGSGYQLAMRDMEIRGVGNILGFQQSGQMELIGFDLYMEILQESLAEMQGQEIPHVDDTQIDLAVTAFIPGDWITDSQEKISAYRQATRCNSEEELIDLVLLWTDRYGKIPPAVETLFQILRIKLLAKKLGISRISKIDKHIVMETPMNKNTFSLLREGLPDQLKPRLIFKESKSKYSELIARGLGILDIEKQLEQIMEWFKLMLKQIDK